MTAPTVCVYGGGERCVNGCDTVTVGGWPGIPAASLLSEAKSLGRTCIRCQLAIDGAARPATPSPGY